MRCALGLQQPSSFTDLDLTGNFYTPVYKLDSSVKLQLCRLVISVIRDLA